MLKFLLLYLSHWYLMYLANIFTYMFPVVIPANWYGVQF